MVATYQFLIMSIQCLRIVLITNPALGTSIIQNVMFAATLFLQIHLVSLSTGSILSGDKNTAPRMSMMELLVAVVVREWSLGTRDIYRLMMEGSCV
uniref:Uncharacterized protein n=1 Tax=Salix viminalis TaxID=40686 RepID=A0A6N2L9A8_SALVM